MAFEDRFSPNAATSPNSGDVSQHPPDSPESSRTSPYTCPILQKSHYITPTTDLSQISQISQTSSTTTSTTTQSNTEVVKSSFFRITSYALSKQDESSLDQFKVYQTQTTRSPLSSPVQSSTSDSECSNSERPPSNCSLPEPSTSLKYSIHNILQPDFGKSAVQRTKSIKIGFKPYEKPIIPQSPAASVSPALSTVSSIGSTAAPLGSLCQTVSQIGRTKHQADSQLLPTVNIAKTEPVSVSASASSSGNLSDASSKNDDKNDDPKIPTLWPAWVYCTRYSDRPSSGPRSRRMKKPPKPPSTSAPNTTEEKRPRTAFSGAQLARLKHEFAENRYLTERRRQQLSAELGLNEAQIKIWFQNKRAKIKKASGQKNPLALQLMAQGLYNHSTVACDEDDMPLTPDGQPIVQH